MLAGSEELFVTLGSQGWLESLCLPGCCCSLGDTVLSERGLSSTDSLTDLCTLVGSERLRKIPGWGDRLTTGGLMSWRGSAWGEDRGWEAGDLCWRVCVWSDSPRKDICSFTELAVFPPVLPSLVSGLQVAKRR